jgi:hypothetical protein
MTLGNLAAILIIVFLVGGTLGFFGLIVMLLGKRTAKLHKSMQQLGFERANNQSYHHAVNRMRALLGANTPSYQSVNVYNVYEKREGNKQVYVMDVDNPLAQPDSYDRRGIALMIAPDLNLPRLVMYPTLPVDSMKELPPFFTNLLMQNLPGRNMSEVHFDNHPDFKQHFEVRAENPEAVQELLSEARLQAIMALRPGYSIEAAGDALCVREYFAQQADNNYLMRLVHTLVNASRILVDS